MNGKVKFFNTDKGYGFISSEGKDYFFHFSNILNGTEAQENDEVSFETQPGKK